MNRFADGPMLLPTGSHALAATKAFSTHQALRGAQRLADVTFCRYWRDWLGEIVKHVHVLLITCSKSFSLSNDAS